LAVAATNDWEMKTAEDVYAKGEAVEVMTEEEAKLLKNIL
jgi:hypothetical protein